MSERRERLDHLDALRGLAALLVLGGHVRAFSLTSYASITDAGIGSKIFYALTSLGHEAVIVFFALSGFLVGGAALEAMLERRFSWPRFLLRRAVRLLIVIVPALAATALFDAIGLSLTGGAGYDGSLYDIYVSGPSTSQPLDHSLTALLGNIAFLQSIHAPIFGSNGPMWSLAYEFWYYLLFPLAASLALVPYGARGRAIASAALIGVLALLPVAVLVLGLIWAAGAAAAWAAAQPRGAAWVRTRTARGAILALALGVLAAGKLSALGGQADLALGLAIALALPVLAHLPNFGSIYRAGARGTAALSYTLYLTHFPLLSMIVFASLTPQRFAPGIAGAALFAGLTAAALLWAGIVWWCFERNTDRLYVYLAARWLKPGVIFPSSAA